MALTEDRSSPGHKILGYLGLFFVLGLVLIAAVWFDVAYTKLQR